MGERQQRRLQTQIREHSERRVGEAGGDIDDRHARRAIGVTAVVERGARKAADCDVGRLQPVTRAAPPAAGWAVVAMFAASAV